MKNDGWIIIHRKFREWEWYKDSKMVHLFIHLITTANHKPKKWKGIQVDRGQLVTGRKQLSKETGLSERSIRTCLDRLRTTSEVTIKTTNKYSIITICQYDDYQKKKRPTDQQNDQQTVQQTTTNNNDKEYKKRESTRKISFKDSGLRIEDIRTRFANSESETIRTADPDHYFHKVANADDSLKYSNWELVPGRWALRDAKNGKLVKMKRKKETQL